MGMLPVRNTDCRESSYRLEATWNHLVSIWLNASQSARNASRLSYSPEAINSSASPPTLPAQAVALRYRIPGTHRRPGLTDIPFTYEEFEQTRSKLIDDVNTLLTDDDKRFLVSFEKGDPQWSGYEFEYFKAFPSVKWKLMNLAKLSKLNPQKLAIEAKKLEKIFGI